MSFTITPPPATRWWPVTGYWGRVQNALRGRGTEASDIQTVWRWF